MSTFLFKWLGKTVKERGDKNDKRRNQTESNSKFGRCWKIKLKSHDSMNSFNISRPTSPSQQLLLSGWRPWNGDNESLRVLGLFHSSVLSIISQYCPSAWLTLFKFHLPYENLSCLFSPRCYSASKLAGYQTARTFSFWHLSLSTFSSSLSFLTFSSFFKYIYFSKSTCYHLWCERLLARCFQVDNTSSSVLLHHAHLFSSFPIENEFSFGRRCMNSRPI